MSIIYRRAGDTGSVVDVVLTNDGTAVDLSGAVSIACRQVNRNTGAVTATITGLSGNSDGEVSTTFADALTEGVYVLDWVVEHTASQELTYPGDDDDRPQMHVRG